MVYGGSFKRENRAWDEETDADMWDRLQQIWLQ